VVKWRGWLLGDPFGVAQYPAKAPRHFARLSSSASGQFRGAGMLTGQSLMLQNWVRRCRV
jgi:hypothetical protein